MLTQQAFAAAFETGFQATIRLLLSKGLRIETAEELAQAAWARGWEAIHQLKDESRIGGWINTIAVNTMCNEMRRNKRFETLETVAGKSGSPPVSSDKIDADRLLQRCSKLDRSLIEHRYSGGWEMEEIARLHGLTGVATRVRIHRARNALRRYLTATDRLSAAAC